MNQRCIACEYPMPPSQGGCPSHRSPPRCGRSLRLRRRRPHPWRRRRHARSVCRRRSAAGLAVPVRQAGRQGHARPLDLPAVPRPLAAPPSAECPASTPAAVASPRCAPCPVRGCFTSMIGMRAGGLLVNDLKAAGALPSSAVTKDGCPWSHTIKMLALPCMHRAMHPQIDSHEHIGETV